MKKYDTNTILLAIIAGAISIFALSKLYEAKMMHDLMYADIVYKPTAMDKPLEEMTKAQNETLKHIGNITGNMQNVQKQFNQEMTKLKNPPQIQMPQIPKTQETPKEIETPHEYSNKNKVKIEIK